MKDLPFNTMEFAKAWEEWMQYRKERKLPKYVPTGLKKTFSALFKTSEGIEEIAIKMIEQSIEHNWQGIFKIKDNGSSKNGKQSTGKVNGQQLNQAFAKFYNG